MAVKKEKNTAVEAILADEYRNLKFLIVGAGSVIEFVDSKAIVTPEVYEKIKEYLQQ